MSIPVLPAPLRFKRPLPTLADARDVQPQRASLLSRPQPGSTFVRARTCREPVLLSTGPSLDLMMVEKGSDPLWISRQCLSDPDMGKGMARRLIPSAVTLVCRTVLIRV